MTLFRRLALILLLAMGALAYVGVNLNTAYAGFNQEVFVNLPKGTSARQMAGLLQNAGVIRHSWTFLIARVFRRDATLQAGEYRFTQPASVLEIFDRIHRGDIFYYELVVPEGKNMFDIAAAVERLLGESAAARRVVAAHEASKYERVQEALRDVTARIDEYDLTPAVNAGIARYNERFTEDEDDGADDAVPVTDEEDQ